MFGIKLSFNVEQWSQNHNQSRLPNYNIFSITGLMLPAMPISFNARDAKVANEETENFSH